MQHKRGRYQICSEILKAALGGARKTPLVYGTNTNFLKADEYIREMLANGLMTMEVLPGGGGRNKLYVTTERGLAFIKSLEETLAIFRGLTFPPIIVHTIPIREVP